MYRTRRDSARRLGKALLNPRVAPIIAIVIAALLASSNGLQFGKVFFPADVLSDYPPWQVLGSHGSAAQNPLLRDPVIEFHPWEMLIRSALRTGHWPLWNPYSFMGSPLLGNGQISAFTIFALPLHLFGAIPGYLLMAFLKLSVAGLSMFYFARARNLASCAATVSGMTFMLSGHMMAWLHFPLSGGLALAPLSLLAAERLAQKPSRVWFAVMTLSVAMLALCGQPQTSFCIGFLLGAYVVYRLFCIQRTDDKRRFPWKRSLWLLLAAACGLGLSLFQSLAFAEYLRYSAAEVVRNAYNVFSLPIYQLVTLLLPDFFGNSMHGNYWGYANTVGPAIYIGVLPLFLAVAGIILGWRGSDARFFAATTLYCLIIVTKTLGTGHIFDLPFLAGITINKFIGPFTLAAAFLAGTGVDLLWTRTKAVIILCSSLLGAGLACAFVFAVHFWRWISQMNLGHYELLRGFPLLIVTPLALLAFWYGYRCSSTSTVSVGVGPNIAHFLAAGALIFAISLDCLHYWLNFNPSVKAEYLYPATGVGEFLEKDSSIWRLMGIGDAFLPNTASAYGFQDALGYDGVTYYRYYNFMSLVDPGFKDLNSAMGLDTLAARPWDPHTSLANQSLLELMVSKGPEFRAFLKEANYWNYAVRSCQNRRLLDLMNVKYVVTPPSWSSPVVSEKMKLVYDKEVRVYLNQTVLPRSFLVSHWVRVRDDEEAMRLVSDPQFEPAKTAVLEDMGGNRSFEYALSEAPVDESPGVAKVVSYQSERIVISAVASRDAVLLLSDTWYPGWRCSVDGQEAPVYAADYLFRGVPISTGKHDIVFSYEPSSFTWGLRFSVLAVVACLISLWLI